MNSTTRLNKECIEHLEAALDTDDPTEKNFHIRQVLQMCGAEDGEGADVEECC